MGLYLLEIYFIYVFYVEMKIIPGSPKAIIVGLTVCAALLNGVIVNPARAGSANDPALSQTDVSQFPNLDQLPGKVPPHVWPGLANVWRQNHAHWKMSATNDMGAVVFWATPSRRVGTRWR